MQGKGRTPSILELFCSIHWTFGLRFSSTGAYSWAPPCVESKRVPPSPGSTTVARIEGPPLPGRAGEGPSPARGRIAPAAPPPPPPPQAAPARRFSCAVSGLRPRQGWRSRMFRSCAGGGVERGLRVGAAPGSRRDRGAGEGGATAPDGAGAGLGRRCLAAAAAGHCPHEPEYRRRNEIAGHCSLARLPRTLGFPDRAGGSRIKIRGKSGLHRAGCRLTAGRGDPRDSATENTPPGRGQVRSNRWCKRPPRRQQ
ncbi:MAG: hypothetical protein GMKNLPBB_00053 [Myxococcota bacterium]|nr:hypothetical protein [Myxococcota bacterium]